MSQATPEIHDADALIDRLADGSRRVVFLVGSALTMPSAADKPGVANVDAIRELIRARIGTPKGGGVNARSAATAALQKLDAALAKAPDAGAKYRLAFEHLKGRVDGAESVNEVIRTAVLHARTDYDHPRVDDVGALAKLEGSPEGWYLGPAVKALGLILARHPKRFGGTVLTTNFDPLVEVAMRAAKGQAQAVELVGDGTLPTLDPVVTSVVHLHGLWRGDSLNTSLALTREREALSRSLARLYDGVTLVVLGYGGWDDVLMRALAELTIDVGAKPDVLWCFYPREAAEIRTRYPDVLNLLGKLGERSVCYAGVDCNEVLPMLRARLDDECEIIGRGVVCNALLDALHAEQAVELIGEHWMKRSKLLQWMERQTTQFGARAARFSAHELGANPTPEALVRRVAVATGLEAEVVAELRQQHSVPEPEDAARALKLLRGTWILIDDAEALAVEGHGFTGTFFSELRGEVQAKEIHWISVSSTPLGKLFEAHGLTSKFLNDAIKIRAGGLDEREVAVAVSARLGERAKEALDLAGTLPGLVHRLCDAEWGDVDGALRGLSTWAQGFCALWWARAPPEQDVLRNVVKGLAYADMTSDQRGIADDLLKRGLLVETMHGFALNGSVWGTYVRDRQ
jgi:hypothetical protein